MYKYLAVIIFMLFLGSCLKQPSEEKIIQIPVKFDNKTKKIGLSNIGYKIQYIPLEKSPEILLGTIKKVLIYDRIYCLQSNKINVFDLQGKILYEINHYRSKGPEGYNELSDFLIDSTTNTIEIWDRSGRKIVRYSKADGTFINSHSFRTHALTFIKDSEGNYLFWSGYQHQPFIQDKNEKYHIIKFNNTGMFQDTFLKVPANKLVGVESNSILYSYKGNVFLHPPADQYVYKYEQNNFREFIFLNFGIHQINEDYFKSMKRYGVYELENSGFAWSLGEFKEFDKGYSYIYNFGSRKYFQCFASKKTRETVICSGFLNDFDGYFSCGIIHNIQDNLFIQPLDAYALKNIYKEIRRKYNSESWLIFKNAHKIFCTMCENLQETDNPVLLLITPKEI